MGEKMDKKMMAFMSVLLVLFIMFTACSPVDEETAAPGAEESAEYQDTVIATTTEVSPEHQPTITATELEASSGYQEDMYSISKSILFDSLTDLELFNYGAAGAPDHSQQELSPSDFISEGIINLDGKAIDFLDLNVPINAGVAIHARWKTTSEKICHSLCFIPPFDQSSAYKMALGGCSQNVFNISFENDQAQVVDNPYVSEGMVFVEEDKWMDAVIWFEFEPVPAFTALTWETDHPENFFVEKKMLPKDAQTGQFMFTFEVYDGSMAVDLVEIITGDIESYLWNNTSAFQDKYSMIQPVLAHVFDVETAAVVETPGPTVDAVTSSAFSDVSDAIHAAMLHYEDLPEDLGMYQIEQKTITTFDTMRFQKTFLQGPTSSGGGLWITNEITILEDPIQTKRELLESVDLNLAQEGIRPESPEVGDFSASFYRSPFERFVFSRGNVTVDLYCNSLYTGIPPACYPDQLVLLANLISERLPESVPLPPMMALSFEEGHQDDYLEFVDVVEDLSGIQLRVTAMDYLPSLTFVLYSVDFEEFVYIYEVVDPEELGIGPHDYSLNYGQASDRDLLYPGQYIIYVIVDNAVVATLDFEKRN
jgi:hypothetical protein